VQYGKLVEAARVQIEEQTVRPWYQRAMRRFIFNRLLQTPWMMTAAGALLFLYQASGLQKLVRALGLLNLLGGLGRLEALAPPAEPPFFFGQIGKTFPAEGEQRYRVAFLAGCIANVSFARLNEATVRVLQKNGCEVVIPEHQGCCGALHAHSGLRDEARKLARNNIDALMHGKWDAIITNAAGCGSTLKEYGELLADDPAYAIQAHKFSGLMKDVTEFLSAIPLNTKMAAVDAVVTYQDSCHLAHGQKIRTSPRKLLAAVPGLTFREMPFADVCCGSAGIYNVVQNEMAMQILERKMDSVNSTAAGVVATANPGCMLQLRAGVRLHGKGQRVLHVVEVLDEAYRGAEKSGELRHQ
jgi:glycolate oxidase iron-sulfur subunit